MSVVTSTTALLVFLTLVAGETQGPKITPPAQTLRVVKTAFVGTILSTLESASRFTINDQYTDQLVRLDAIDSKGYRVQVVLKSSLLSEKTPITRQLYITSTSDEGYTSTATITLQLVDPVSIVESRFSADFQEAITAVTSHVGAVKTACNNDAASSSSAATRFRMYCLLFRGVYGFNR